MTRRGFTLTELLVTIAIVAIIMGISTAALRRAGTKDALVATQQSVRALLRRSRNAAREERYQVTVHIDAEASELTAQQKTTVTQFHLESLGATPIETTPGFVFAAEPRPLTESSAFIHEGAKGYQLYSEDAAAAAGKVGDALLFEKNEVEGAAWAWVEHRPALMPAGSTSATSARASSAAGARSAATPATRTTSAPGPPGARPRRGSRTTTPWIRPTS